MLPWKLEIEVDPALVVRCRAFVTPLLQLHDTGAAPIRGGRAIGRFALDSTLFSRRSVDNPGLICRAVDATHCIGRVMDTAVHKTGGTEGRGRGQSKAETRARLLEAASEEFLATGYRGATLDAIAARAGFTKGALYWHFPNKQALFLALVADSIAANFERLENILDSNRDDPEALRGAVGTYVDAIDEVESLPIFGVELEIEARGDPSFRTLHQGLIEQHEATITKVLDHYFTATGTKPPMPLDQLTATLVALFKGFALSRHNRSDMPVGSSSAVRLLLGLPT